MTSPRGSALLRHWLKFNAVGGIGIGVQLAFLTALASGLGLSYLAATGLAVEAAVLHNFIWHERWTWADRTRGSGRTLRSTLGRLLRFNLTTGLVSIGGNLLLMRLFVGNLHVPVFFSNVLSIALCSIANFLLSDRFVFQLTPLPKQEET